MKDFRLLCVPGRFTLYHAPCPICDGCTNEMGHRTDKPRLLNGYTYICNVLCVCK